MIILAKVQQAATALLYLGPLLAGLAGFGWGLLLPFALIYTIRLLLMRQRLWAEAGPKWFSPPALQIMLTQLLLIGALIAIGRGIGGVLGYTPGYHPLWPLGVSLVGASLPALVPLRRLWSDLGTMAEAGPPAAPRAAFGESEMHQPLPRPGDSRRSAPRTTAPHH